MTVYYLFDDIGLYLGTSEVAGPDRTVNPYPLDKNGYYRLVDGSWELIFGIDVNGDLTNDPLLVADRPAEDPGVDLLAFNPSLGNRPSTVGPADMGATLPGLTQASLDAAFVDAEATIRASAVFQSFPGGSVEREYGVFRQGDVSLNTVAMYWVADAGLMFTAQVNSGAIEILYGHCLPGQADMVELDPATLEVTKVYVDHRLGNDPVSGETLLEIYYTEGVNGLDDDLYAEALAKGLPYLDRTWACTVRDGVKALGFTVPQQ